MIPIRAQRIRYEPGRVMPAHVDGHRRLSILLSGTLDERDSARTEHATPGSVGLKAPRFEHTSTFGPDGTTILSLLLPEDVLARFGLRPREVAAWRWRHTPADRAASLALAAASARGDGTAVTRALPAVLCAFRRTCPAQDPPHPLVALRDALADAPAEPPDVRALAERHGMHAVSLGRAFRRHFGCSMTRFRQRVRVADAALHVVGTEAPLTQIALDHGFADASHMTRLFRRELGTCPGSLRRVLRAAARGLGTRGLCTRGLCTRGLSTRGLESFKTEWTIPV